MQLISIVIPLYNKAKSVERAVRSVLAQTVADFELIVVDNGSSDGSAEIVAGIGDSRIRLVVERSRGVSYARNRGISEARGEWVAFLDADDEWMPTFLESCCQLHDKYPQCELLATAYKRCDSDGRMQDIIVSGIPAETDFMLDNYFEVAAQSDPPFCSISVMVRKEALLAVAGFPTGIAQGEDLLTWARLAAGCKIAYCREPQCVFYIDGNSGQEKPKRIPPEIDIVGEELAALFRENPEIVGLRQYIASWHKMRASMFLRLPSHGRACRKEVCKARQWLADNNNQPRIRKRLNMYMLMSFIPYNIRMKLLSFANH